MKNILYGTAVLFSAILAAADECAMLEVAATVNISPGSDKNVNCAVQGPVGGSTQAQKTLHVTIPDISEKGWTPVKFYFVPGADGHVDLIFSSDKVENRVAFTDLCVRGAEENANFPIAGDTPVNALKNGDFKEELNGGWRGSGTVIGIDGKKAGGVTMANTLTITLKVKKDQLVIVSGKVRKQK